MESSVFPSRRQVIAGVGASALALAGCATEEPTGQPSAGQPSASGSSKAPETSESPKPSESPETSEEPAGATLTALDDVKVGESVLVKSGSDEVLVCRISDTEAVAYSAICTHKGCTVEPSGKELKCPCHASRFNTTDGGVLGGPAQAPLAKFDVHVKGGNVVAGTA